MPYDRRTCNTTEGAYSVLLPENPWSIAENSAKNASGGDPEVARTSRHCLLRLSFPRAKLRRQIFMTRAEVWAKNWAKNWAKISAHFCASFAVQNDPQIFSQNSSQFITLCLVAEILKFHLRELLGCWGRNCLRLATLRGAPREERLDECFTLIFLSWLLS